MLTPKVKFFLILWRKKRLCSQEILCTKRKYFAASKQCAFSPHHPLFLFLKCAAGKNRSRLWYLNRHLTSLSATIPGWQTRPNRSPTQVHSCHALLLLSHPHLQKMSAEPAGNITLKYYTWNLNQISPIWRMNSYLNTLERGSRAKLTQIQVDFVLKIGELRERGR